MSAVNRREREKQLRRNHILDAARDVFAAKGFTGATMEEIAFKADYKPATLYLYFKNKYDLYATLSLELLQRLAQRWEALAEAEKLDPREKISRVAEVLIEVYESDPVTMVNLFRQQASRGLRDMSPEMVEQINGMAARAIRGLARIFADGIKQGLFRDHHPMALADSVWAVFTGMVLWEESKRFFDPRKHFFEPTLKLAIDLMIEGLSND